MIFTTAQIREILVKEKEDNALISRELLNETLAWIEKFDTYADCIEFDLEGNYSYDQIFICVLNINKTVIEKTVMVANNRRKHKSGPTPKPAAQLRKNLIGIYLNDSELSHIAICAGANIPVRKPGGDTTSRRKIASYMRRSAFGSLPPKIPQLNQKAWSELKNVLNNLNQIALKLNSGKQANDVDSRNIAEIKNVLVALRPTLLEHEL